ncbi:MAG TPA: SDR family oxidoreductase [Candidatus Dormibacteraeota bacterium]|nr:SDR family oxidoreductase [Candidatus Dormibacteraeota bacterium]
MKSRSVLVTGTSRARGIGAEIARRLAADGWNVGLTWWLPGDDGMPWAGTANEPHELVAALRAAGARVAWHEADLADPAAPARIFDAIGAALGGPVGALVCSHALSMPGGIMDTPTEDFDRHVAINARAALLLIRELAARLPAGTPGRIVTLTSDALDGEVAYGASKAALDRVTIAAARELGHRGITANAVNPGPIDTGWMTQEIRDRLLAATPLGRLGTAADAAALVAFLCSEDGGWVTGQVLFSNGGLPVPG